jgi:bis(5'-nucleosyl)-tetraphosphatase (symmetrical)
VSRTICIGDVHGCLELLERLLGRVNYEPSSDVLVFVGDLVDRGPAPAGVVRFVRALQAKGPVRAVMGNHEDKMLRWFERVERERKTGKKNGMHPPGPERLAQWNELTDEDRQWLGKLPVILDVAEGWLAVHAGFEAVPMDQQKPDRVMRVRWIDSQTGEHKGLDRDADDPFAIPTGCVNWMDRWAGPQNVVYGHAVHSRKTPRVDRPHPGIETWGIDTGACFGGRLTALCLETREVFQVEDGKSYARLHAKMADEL